MRKHPHPVATFFVAGCGFCLGESAGEKKTLEGGRPPFRMGVFSLQTSLIPPNFPARQPPLGSLESVCLVERRLLCREFFGNLGGAKVGESAAVAPQKERGKILSGKVLKGLGKLFLKVFQVGFGAKPRGFKEV